MRPLGRHMRIGLAAALACCATALAPAMASADVSDLLPAVSPPGANDFTCRPTAAHPAPVVLVHGTFEGAADNWATASPKFKAAGYCVFALEYGDRGTGDIAASAGQLAALRRRGARRHRSAQGLARRPLAGRDDAALLPQVPGRRGQGRRPRRPRALQPRHDQPGRDRRRRDLLPGVRAADAPARPSSRNLNAGDETPGAVSYTQIETRYDEVVTPYTSAFLAPGPRTANILLQDACPAEVIDHHEMPNDGLAIRWALQALGRPGPADPAHPPSCI